MFSDGYFVVLWLVGGVLDTLGNVAFGEHRTPGEREEHVDNVRVATHTVKEAVLAQPRTASTLPCRNVKWCAQSESASVGRLRR